MQSLNELHKKKELNMAKQRNLQLIKIRKAEVEDVDDIIHVASSVGKGKNESYNGFLMDNYRDNKLHFKRVFQEKIQNLEFFYVAEKQKKVIGFLIGYTKEEWLLDNPNWIEEILWNPNFDLEITKDFVLSDKMAILANYTGRGVGSKIYKRFMNDMNTLGYKYLFSETIIDPIPNFASLSFRKKQSYKLAGMRYEKHDGVSYADLIYYKPIDTIKWIE